MQVVGPSCLSVAFHACVKVSMCNEERPLKLKKIITGYSGAILFSVLAVDLVVDLP